MNTHLKERRAKDREYAVKKLGGKCVRCGTTHDLTFDHIGNDRGGVEARKISQLVGGSREKLDEELAKCQILCRPCHGRKSVYEDQMRPQGHGTIAQYGNKNGCRCDPCKLAWSNYMRKRNRVKLER